jgi:hypothetical protein
LRAQYGQTFYCHSSEEHQQSTKNKSQSQLSLISGLVGQTHDGNSSAAPLASSSFCCHHPVINEAPNYGTSPNIAISSKLKWLKELEFLLTRYKYLTSPYKHSRGYQYVII